MRPSVVHRPSARGSSGRFVLEADGRQVGQLDYSLPDAKTLCIDYVEVAPAMRGKQLGERLVGAAVEWAQSEKRAVTATCGFARVVLARTQHR